MRVIAGKAKGRKLISPKNSSTRPALAQVKEAVFNILGRLNGESVLDLFAGSGSIGIEALSRGAGKTTFVENGRAALKALRQNLELCGFEELSNVMPTPVDRALQRLTQASEQFELIFVDPPYDKNLVQPTLEKLEKILADGGTIIVESSPREGVHDTEAIQTTDQRKYGQTLITFLQTRRS